MKVASLSVCIEQMQHMFVLYQYLTIEDALIWEGIAHHSIRVGVELGLDDGEPRHDQKPAIRCVARKQRGRFTDCVVDQACLLGVANQSLLSRVQSGEHFLEADDIKVI